MAKENELDKVILWVGGTDEISVTVQERFNELATEFPSDIKYSIKLVDEADAGDFIKSPTLQTYWFRYEGLGLLLMLSPDTDYPDQDLIEIIKNERLAYLERVRIEEENQYKIPMEQLRIDWPIWSVRRRLHR